MHSGVRRPDAAACPLSAADVAAVVAMAGRAPSVHNTQPWRFAIHDSAIDLLADTSRLLPSIDPDGRELMISCGAALFGLRLGMRSRAGCRSPSCSQIRRGRGCSRGSWPRVMRVSRLPRPS